MIEEINNNKKEVNPQIGIELTGLFLAGNLSNLLDKKESLYDLVNGLKISGYTGLATLPTRFMWSAENNGIIGDLALPIMAFGNEFSPNQNRPNESLRIIRCGIGTASRILNNIIESEELSNTMQKHGMTLEDFVLFPNQRRTQQMMLQILYQNKPVIFSVHSTEEAIELQRIIGNFESSNPHKISLEAHNDINFSPEEYNNWSLANEIGLTFDTCHIRDILDENCNWEQNLDLLIKRTNLLHFQPSRKDKNELRSTLNSKPTELDDMIKGIRSLNYKGPVIVETMFPLNIQFLDTIKKIYGPWLPKQKNNPHQNIISIAKDINMYLREELYGY